MFGAFNKKGENTNNFGFRKNIKFNHLYVVIDDSTYKYLFDSLKFLTNFGRTREETINAGSDSWRMFTFNKLFRLIQEDLLMDRSKK